MTYWQPAKPDDTAERMIILALAQDRIIKELERAKKQLARESDKLHQADMHNASQRRRTTLRINASLAAKERDRWERRLQLLQEWRAELMQENTSVVSAE